MILLSIKNATPTREVDVDEQQPHRISLRFDDVEVVQAYANQFGVEYDKHFETEGKGCYWIKKFPKFYRKSNEHS